MTVVIIEDSPTQRLKLRAELQASGYTVVATADGCAGLEACRSLPSPPIAVITDIVMPGMDGYEVCRQLKADPALASVPVLVLTELTRPADVLRAVDAGADNYCTKPYALDALLDRLRRSVALSHGTTDDEVEVDGERFRVQGRPARLVDILVSGLTDASDRYRELEQSRAELQQVNDQREEVMRMVVHELRSPLHAMMTAASMAPRHAEVKADLPALVHRQGQRIQRILGDLSDLTSIQLGRLRVERAPHDLVALLEGAVERLEPALAGHHVALAVPDGPLHVELDPDRVEQVLTNLLVNAAKYSPDTDRIDVTVTRCGDRARVEVHDRGIGISEPDRARIFERYYRTSPGERQAEGLGLGLFLSRHLIEAHGGEIGVDSEIGVGSTFWFEVPLASP